MWMRIGELAAHLRTEYLHCKHLEIQYLQDAEYHAKVYHASYITAKLFTLLTLTPDRKDI